MADATHKGRKCTPTPPPGTAAPGDAPLWKGGRGSQESCAARHPAGKAETHEKAEGRGEPVLKSLVPGLAEEGKNGRQLLKFSSALLSRGSLCAGRNYMGAPPFGCKRTSYLRVAMARCGTRGGMQAATHEPSDGEASRTGRKRDRIPVNAHECQMYAGELWERRAPAVSDGSTWETGLGRNRRAGVSPFTLNCLL